MDDRSNQELQCSRKPPVSVVGQMKSTKLFNFFIYTYKKIKKLGENKFIKMKFFVDFVATTNDASNKS